MRHSLLLFLLISFTFIAQSQEQVTGIVLDNDEIGIAFANVVLLNEVDSSLVRGTITEDDGSFQILNIKPGRYFLQASLIGYDNYNSVLFSLPNPDNSSFTLYLSTGSTTLDEITVTAEKPLFEQKVDRTVVNVENSIVATGGSVLSILERSPGIDVDRINNQLRMQGKQGILVLLDGKMMRMEPAGLIQLLESLPADNIATIELITTPPASFDAEGDAGIIQINTKKRNVDGSFASLSLNAGYGVRPKAGGSFNLNVQKNKINFFADLSANINRTRHNTEIFRQNNFENTLTSTRLNSNRPATQDLYNYRLGLDYDLSPASTIGVLLSGYWTHWNMHATTLATVLDEEGSGFNSLLRGHEVNNWRHWMVNLNFRHRFSENSSLSVDLDYLNFFDNNPTAYAETFSDLDGQELEQNFFFSRKKTPVDFKVAKLDYERQFSEQLKLEVGLKSSLSSFVNDLALEDLVNDVLVPDPRFTDLFDLDENLSAAYGSVDYKVSPKISAKLGLRFEYYDSELTSNQEGLILSQSYGRLFPTASFTYQPNEEQQFNLSYSERISRPAINTIAPAFYFWGYNTLLGGNPAVRPTISRQLSTSFRYKTLLLSFQYSDDDLPTIYQPAFFPEENLTINRAENMLDQQSAVLTITLPVKFSESWESRYNVSAYWQRMRPIFEGQVIQTSNNFYTANTTQSFKLPADFNFELSGQFRTSLMWGLAEVPFQGSIDMGFKKTLSANTSLSLNWTDVFNTGSFFEVNYREPELNVLFDWRYNMEGSVIRLSFSHNFGNSKIKQRENRNTGSEEERGRMN